MICEIQTKTQKNTGICINCSWADNCCYSGTEPQFCCEEYCPADSQESVQNTVCHPVIPSLNTGICMTCEDFGSCAIKSVLPVWSCSEYC